MTAEIRAAALRIEMAEGRVQSCSQGGGVDLGQLDEAMFDRDSERTRFHALIREVTGIEPGTLARLLTI